MLRGLEDIIQYSHGITPDKSSGLEPYFLVLRYATQYIVEYEYETPVSASAIV